MIYNYSNFTKTAFMHSKQIFNNESAIFENH